MAKKTIPNFERIIRSKKFGIMHFENCGMNFIYCNTYNGEPPVILKTNGFQGELIKGKWTKKTFNRAVLSWYSDLWHATN